MKPVKNSHVNFIYKHTIFCLPLSPVKLPSDLPNCSIRPAIHLCVAPWPLQVLRYFGSPSLRLFPLKRSLPEARISPRHLPTRSRSQTRRCFRLVSRRRPEPFPVLLRLPSFSLVFWVPGPRVSGLCLFFFFFLSEYVSYFLKFYFIVVSTLGLRSTCHTALLTVDARSCRRSPELTPCLTLFLDLLLCFAVRNVWKCFYSTLILRWWFGQVNRFLPTF